MPIDIPLPLVWNVISHTTRTFTLTRLMMELQEDEHEGYLY